ncbi:DeoR/GlpR family DNA-binding transcription regulator [Actinocorallia sp. A-T 12471]|uniref:DeoR/GlpR family DNA-binding transcription regulator n=1 Tax=Actinocorallia sp. A-T 12471 TaxID=3089813 RepID=UPI0029CD1370|nr:DeoR/GlpR family DNA-binding transcription regulator [Actinocorallia sp. A-T 12471]MDX6740610.1 DeoR/GlpR family DNA-binding transcription regulator [Actinocorallia sp. A-T 12471]
METVTEQGLLVEQRRMQILETVRRDGAVRVTDLALTYGVSEMTIRRDLDLLSRSGTLEKVHGGAVAVGMTEEPGFAVKSGLESTAKGAIAGAAAALVKPGTVVAIGGGTTTYAVAEQLLGVPDLTIVTNSLPIERLVRAASDKGAHPPVVLLTGGTATRSEALVGPIADRTIDSLHVDLLILGTHGITESEGLTSPNLAEAQTNRVFVSRARRVAVVADHTKWGITGLSTFADLDQIGWFITDGGLPEEARSVLAGRCELVIPSDEEDL